MAQTGIDLHPLASIPRSSRLQVRATIVVLGLVAVAVGGSIWILTQMIQVQIASAIDRDTVLLSEGLVQNVAPLIDQNREEELRRLLAQSNANPQIAFVSVQDAAGLSWYDQVNDARLWSRFQKELQANPREMFARMSRPAPLKDTFAVEARVYRTPIFSSEHMEGSDVLSGYLVVGVVDPIYRSTIEQIWSMATGVIALACLLSVPVTVLLVRQLVRPLRQIARATAILAAGETPPPLTVTRQDEVGLLARSFDEMAKKLDIARRELIRANTDLEAQVSERTQQLSRVNELLQQEIETKNEFLRTVSHDLNAPLRNIAGMTAMIQKRFGSELPDEVHTRLDRIAANVNLETSMLDDLLELSRLRTKPGRSEKINLNELITQIIETLEHEMTERGITCTITTQLPSIHVELNLARQVFLNLIDNAVKYMGNQPEKKIRISHQMQEGMLEIHVSDTGPGVREEDLEEVFQIFRRGTGSEATEVQGRGIGLPSVRMVAERWGGGVFLESEVGDGSIFIVAIPGDRVVHDD